MTDGSAGNPGVAAVSKQSFTPKQPFVSLRPRYLREEVTTGPERRDWGGSYPGAILPFGALGSASGASGASGDANG